MAQRIAIQIRDKIATCLTELPVVCGNSTYVVDFDFDAEWDSYRVKTARFIANCEKIDVVFEGNECPMPPIFKAKIVWVGVFAGNISTSTPAIVYCKPGILDSEGFPAAPIDDVYAQILALLAEVNKGGTNVTIDGEMQASFEVDKYVKRLLAELVDGAPETLDALSEIARALGNDPNFATTILTELGKKANTVNVEAEFAKRNAIKGDGEYSLITSPDNVAQDTWAAAINKDTEAYGGGSFASGGGTVAGVSYEKFLELFSLVDNEDSKALYEAARNRASNNMIVATPQDAGYRYWFSHAEGDGTKAYNRSSHAEGNHSEAHGHASHAEGENTKAIGDVSHAEGASTVARGRAAHVEGSGSNATGDAAHAEGDGSSAIASSAHAEGTRTSANARASHAEGQQTYADGQCSHAEGENTHADGYASHAEGISTQATQSAAHSEGHTTVATAIAAHAEGFGTKAASKYQHVQGKYNVEDTAGKYAHIVGWGTKDAPKNIHTVDTQGNAEFDGDVYSKGERLARVSEIGGGGTTLYEHTVCLSYNKTNSSHCRVCATFTTTDATLIDSFDSLLAVVKSRGSVAASGFYRNGSTKIIVSNLEYSYNEMTKVDTVCIYGVTGFDSIGSVGGQGISNEMATSLGLTFVDTVVTLN